MIYGKHVCIARQQTVCLVTEFMPCLLISPDMSNETFCLQSPQCQSPTSTFVALCGNDVTRMPAGDPPDAVLWCSRSSSCSVQHGCLASLGQVCTLVRTLLVT